jgi:hypothetical protein
LSATSRWSLCLLCQDHQPCITEAWSGASEVQVAHSCPLQLDAAQAPLAAARLSRLIAASGGRSTVEADTPIRNVLRGY